MSIHEHDPNCNTIVAETGTDPLRVVDFGKMQSDRKIASASGANPDGSRFVRLDLKFMSKVHRERLTLWERGQLIEALMDARDAEAPTREQRVLLALFVHQADGANRPSEVFDAG